MPGSGNQLTRGLSRRLMYVENKDGEIDGHRARIGWVTFSRSGLTVYYRGRELSRARGGGIRGNHVCAETGDEYWVSGIKVKGSNTHWAERVAIHVDSDAESELALIRSR